MGVYEGKKDKKIEENEIICLRNTRKKKKMGTCAICELLIKRGDARGGRVTKAFVVRLKKGPGGGEKRRWGLGDTNSRTLAKGAP